MVASPENIVDLMTTPEAMSRRIAGPERPLHFQARRSLAFLQGAPETARLTRQILESGFQGFEPAQDLGGFDLAILSRAFRRASEVNRADFAVSEKRDARLRARHFRLASRLADKTQARIEEPEAGAGLACTRADYVLGHGPCQRGFRPDGQGHEIDQPPHGGFGGTQHCNDGAVEGAGDALLRDAACRFSCAQPQQREQPGDDAREGGAFDGDGGGQGQMVSRFDMEQNENLRSARGFVKCWRDLRRITLVKSLSSFDLFSVKSRHDHHLD